MYQAGFPQFITKAPGRLVKWCIERFVPSVLEKVVIDSLPAEFGDFLRHNARVPRGTRGAGAGAWTRTASGLSYSNSNNSTMDDQGVDTMPSVQEGRESQGDLKEEDYDGKGGGEDKDDGSASLFSLLQGEVITHGYALETIDAPIGSVRGRSNKGDASASAWADDTSTSTEGFGGPTSSSFASIPHVSLPPSAATVDTLDMDESTSAGIAGSGLEGKDEWESGDPRSESDPMSDSDVCAEGIQWSEGGGSPSLFPASPGAPSGAPSMRTKRAKSFNVRTPHRRALTLLGLSVAEGDMLISLQDAIKTFNKGRQRPPGTTTKGFKKVSGFHNIASLARFESFLEEARPELYVYSSVAPMRERRARR